MFSRRSAVINKNNQPDPKLLLGTISRRCAVSSGKRIDNNDAATVIRFLKHNDPLIRQDALKVLARFPNPMTHPFIGRCLTDTSLFVRVEACLAIGRLKIHKLKGKLYDILLSKNPLVICAAATALAQMGDKKGLAYVAKLVCIRGKHQIEAVKTLNIVATKRFSLTQSGVKEATRWINASF